MKHVVDEEREQQPPGQTCWSNNSKENEIVIGKEAAGPKSWRFTS